MKETYIQDFKVTGTLAGERGYLSLTPPAVVNPDWRRTTATAVSAVEPMGRRNEYNIGDGMCNSYRIG